MEPDKNIVWKRLLDEIEEAIPFYTQHLDKFNSIFDEFDEFLTTISNSESSASSNDSIADLKADIQLTSSIIVGYLDSAVAIKGIINSKHQWESAFFIRNLNLTVKAVIESYEKNSSNLRKLVMNEIHSSSNELREISSNLKEFKRQHDFYGIVTSIRNSLTAHISNDYKQYYDLTSKLDTDKTLKMATDFIKWLGRTQELLTLVSAFKLKIALKELGSQKRK